MDQFKYSLSPFEIFSGFISGLPFLFIIYLLLKGEFSFSDFTSNIILNTTFSKLILLILVSYLLGSIVSGISYGYFKRVGNLFRKDYLFTEKSFLSNWEFPFKELTNTEIASLNFKERLVYFIKRRYGEPKLSHLNDYLLIYLRVEAIANAIKSENFIALTIMYRNLSLGFLLLSFVFIYYIFNEDLLINQNIIYAIFCLLVAIITLDRAYTYRSWWARETFLSFYNFEMRNIFDNNNAPKN